MRTLSRRAWVCAVALVMVMGAGPAVAQTVAISTLPPGSINHLQASAVAKVVQEQSGLQMRVITFNSPAAIIGATQNRQAEFAYTSNEEAGSAANGTEDYEGKAMKDLRVAFTVFPFRVGIIVRNNSDIKKVADLKGKRMATDWSGFRQGIALFNGMLATWPHVTGGRLKALAISSAQRVPSAPDTPTVAEQGLPGFETGSYQGVVGPVGIPRETVTKLNGELRKILNTQDIKDRFAKQGTEVRTDTPESLGKWMVSEQAKWARVVKESGAKFE